MVTELFVTDFPLVTVIGDGFEIREPNEDQKRALGYNAKDKIWIVWDNFTQRHVDFCCDYEDQHVRIAIDQLLSARRANSEFVTIY